MKKKIIRRVVMKIFKNALILIMLSMLTNVLCAFNIQNGQGGWLLTEIILISYDKNGIVTDSYSVPSSSLPLAVGSSVTVDYTPPAGTTSTDVWYSFGNITSANVLHLWGDYYKNSNVNIANGFTINSAPQNAMSISDSSGNSTQFDGMFTDVTKALLPMAGATKTFASGDATLTSQWASIGRALVIYDVDGKVISTTPDNTSVAIPSTFERALVGPSIIPWLNIQNNFPKSVPVAIVGSCPFVDAVPVIPTFNTGDDFVAFQQSVKNSIADLKTFITNFTTAVNKWQSTPNDIQNFSTLLTAMDSAQTGPTGYTSSKNAYSACLANPPSTSPTCSTELVNYIQAINTLYNSYANILNFLNQPQYNLAPKWAIPVTRKEEIVGSGSIDKSSGKAKAAYVNGQLLAINTIVNFNTSSFVKQIQAFISCSNTMGEINKEIRQQIVNANATNAQILDMQKMANEMGPEQQAHSPKGNPISPIVGLSLDIVAVSGLASEIPVINSLLGPEMIAFGVGQTLLNKVSLFSGASQDLVNLISFQVNKNLTSDWGFKDYSASGIATGLAKDASKIFDVLAWGPAEMVIQATNTTEAILSGQPVDYGGIGDAAMNSMQAPNPGGGGGGGGSPVPVVTWAKKGWSGAKSVFSSIFHL
jgi:hypothetical protein